LVLEDWLNNLNKEFRDAGIVQKRRPWEAIRRYSDEFKVPVNLSSELAKRIFLWFENHSKPGAHQIGSLYESVYFYDAQFWSVSVPIGYGTFELNALNSLYQMSDKIKAELMSDRKQAWDYMAFWADCVDYGFGLDDLRKTSGLNGYGLQLLMSGDQELRAASSILNQPRQDSRAILNCRMAVEIFFKAYIALKKGLTEKQARSIGHDLNTGLDQFIEVSGYDHWEKLRHMLDVFPEVQERYREQTVITSQLWLGFSLAQSLGTVIVREHTDRNTFEQILDSTRQINSIITE